MYKKVQLVECLKFLPFLSRLKHRHRKHQPNESETTIVLELSINLTLWQLLAGEFESHDVKVTQPRHTIRFIAFAYFDSNILKDLIHIFLLSSMSIDYQLNWFFIYFIVINIRNLSKDTHESLVYYFLFDCVRSCLIFLLSLAAWIKYYPTRIRYTFIIQNGHDYLQWNTITIRTW